MWIFIYESCDSDVCDDGAEAGWMLVAQDFLETARGVRYLAIAMALKLLYPSDTALEIAVLSAHSPRL